jgi:hypothetical protein
VFFDGPDVVWDPNPGEYDSLFAARVEIARTATPYFNLYINNAAASPSTGSIDLTIVTADTIPDDEIIAYVAILQDSLSGAYTTFMYICQELYFFPVELTYPDTLDTIITFSHAIPVNDMKTVVFVQDIDTKEVMQSIISPFEEK